MKYCVLASGSKGNMTYIETERIHVLIDAGITYKEMMRRMPKPITRIDAIFITHEHTDHINGLIPIAKKCSATLYMSEETYAVYIERFKEKTEGIPVRIIEVNRKYTLEDLQVFTLKLSHDTSSCYGFIFAHQKRSLAYITDTGFLPLPYIELLKKVDHLIIESNHDIVMLNESDRTWALKQRILSVRGHMSNYICAQIINTVVQEKRLKTVILAHLSEECNTEELAVDTVLAAIKGDYVPEIKVAKQYEALELIEVNP